MENMARKASWGNEANQCNHGIGGGMKWSEQQVLYSLHNKHSIKYTQLWILHAALCVMNILFNIYHTTGISIWVFTIAIANVYLDCIFSR